MGNSYDKPKWVDSVRYGGIHKCELCEYKANFEENLEEHIRVYHPIPDTITDTWIYLVQFNDISGDIVEHLDLGVNCEPLDGECNDYQGIRIYCGDRRDDKHFEEFGRQVIEVARNRGFGVHDIIRAYGSGLVNVNANAKYQQFGSYPLWWFQGGMRAGVFKAYPIPPGIQVKVCDKTMTDEEIIGEMYDNDEA
jgi:hypothetical protein